MIHFHFKNPFNLELALQLALPDIPLEKDAAIGVWVYDDLVEGVQLASTVEQVFVDLSVVPAEGTVELPVGEVPGIDESDSMRPDLLEEFHHSIGASKLDLADGDGSARVELCGLCLESVEGVQAEELVQEANGLRIQLALRFGGLQVLVKVFDDEVLRVGLAETVEVDKRIIPAALVLIAVLKGLEGKEGGTPCKCGDEVFVTAKNIETGTVFGPAEEVGENLSGVVGWLLALDDRACGFEELLKKSALVPESER